MTDQSKKNFLAEAAEQLNRVIEIHTSLKAIDPSLSKLYPVAIVEDSQFYVFDLSKDETQYEFKMEFPTPMLIPRGVLASFPLDFYGMRPSAVVTMQVFEQVDGCAYLIHEFVHCHQWENGEQKLRSKLEIEKEAKALHTPMWEIMHTFPYADATFVREVDRIAESLDLKGMNAFLSNMKTHLSPKDFEFMVWQLWKEGFARYIENEVRGRLKIELNQGPLKAPYNRVSFYELGSRFIELIKNQNSAPLYSMETLFKILSEVDLTHGS